MRLRSLIDKEKVILSRQGRPGTSSSINSLKEAFRQFEQDLNKLQVIFYDSMNDQRQQETTYVVTRVDQGTKQG